MLNRTPLILVSSLVLAGLAGLGCSSSDDTSPIVTDSGTDSANSDSATDTLLSDSPLSDTPLGDVLANTCTAAGGSCIALTATSKCPDGTSTPSDVTIHCEGVGSMCCVPSVDTVDGGIDGATDATADVHD